MRASPESAVPAAPAARTLPDRLLGMLGGAFVLLALVVLVRGGEEDGAPRASVEAPRIVVADPTGGEVIHGPLQLVFRSETELRVQPSGWGTGDLHLHLQVDDRQYMPATTDIERLPNGAYRWSFRRLEPGPHVLRLFWSDAAHVPVPGGGSPELRVHAK